MNFYGWYKKAKKNKVICKIFGRELFPSEDKNWLMKRSYQYKIIYEATKGGVQTEENKQSMKHNYNRLRGCGIMPNKYGDICLFDLLLSDSQVSKEISARNSQRMQNNIMSKIVGVYGYTFFWQQTADNMVQTEIQCGSEKIVLKVGVETYPNGSYKPTIYYSSNYIRLEESLLTYIAAEALCFFDARP